MKREKRGKRKEKEEEGKSERRPMLV